MFVSGTHYINVSTPPFIQDPSPQSIQRYLHDLAFDDLWQRIKRDFLDWDHTQEGAFIAAGYNLRSAYYQWHNDRDAFGALNDLDKVRAICNERLTPEYLVMYNTVVSYFEGVNSRSGTPVHDQGVHVHERTDNQCRPDVRVCSPLLLLLSLISYSKLASWHFPSNS